MVGDLAGRLRQDSDDNGSNLFLECLVGSNSLVSFIYKNYFVFSKLNTDDMEYHRLKNLCVFPYVGSKYKPNYKRLAIYSWEKLSLTRLPIASSADDDAIFCLAGIVRPLQIPGEYIIGGNT